MIGKLSNPEETVSVCMHAHHRFCCMSSFSAVHLFIEKGLFTKPGVSEYMRPTCEGLQTLHRDTWLLGGCWGSKLSPHIYTAS